MNRSHSDNHHSDGFTLIEILITMAISSIVMVAVYQTFSAQQKSYVIQEETANMQQGIRASMLLLSNDIRMAGYDSQLSGNFSITDIRPRDINNAVDVGITGKSAIQMTEDLDDDGTVGAGETIQYSVYDFGGDGNLDLARDSGSGRRLLAENVRGFGMAYAFDNDFDGNLDTYTIGGNQHIIWAVDSDGDNDLDTNLDTNLDGFIDINDKPAALPMGNSGIIQGSPLASDILPANIRAVRIWLLMETDDNDTGYNDLTTRIAGKYIIAPPGNNKKMRFLSTTIQCRNMGL